MQLREEILERGFAVRREALGLPVTQLLRGLTRTFVTRHAARRDFDLPRWNAGLCWAQEQHWNCSHAEVARQSLGRIFVNEVLNNADWWRSTKPSSCQLAVTFNSTWNVQRFRTPPNIRIWPHTDGYPNDRTPYIWRSRLIVGVLLEDTCHPDEGVFLVGQGSHEFLKAEFKRYPPTSYSPKVLAAWRRTTMRKWFGQRKSYQSTRGMKPIAGPAGTVVFMHPALMHGTHPRTKAGERTMLFFRHLEDGDKKIFDQNLKSARYAEYAKAVDEYHTNLSQHFA